MGQNEWRDAFKQKNGREPSLAEFKAAKANGFALPEAGPDGKEEARAWIKEFEATYNRRPTVQELEHRRNLDTPVANTQPASQFEQTNKPIETSNLAGSDPETTPGARPAKKKSKKNKLIISLVGIAVVLAALVAYGYNYYSYDSSLDRATTALKTYDSDKYQNVTEWSDSKKSLSADNLTPLANYLEDKGMTKSQLRSWLDQSNKGVRFVRDGQKFLIFPHYTVVVDPVDLTVSTNQSGLTLTANGKTLTDKSDSDYSVILKHQAAGLYKFTAEGTLNGQHVKTQDSEYFGNSRNDSIDLNVKTISFTVNSNVDGGSVYVGGTRVATISNGSADINNIAVTKGAKVYVKSQGSGSTIKTDSESLADIDDGDTVTLNSDDVLNKSDAQDQLEDMASDLTSYGQDEDDASDLSSVFTSGSSNKSYQDFSQMIHNNRHSSKRNADSINFGNIVIDQVAAKSKKAVDVTFEMQEDFNYTADTDPDKHTAGTLTQRYQLIAHMVYDSDKGKWLVDSIDSNQKKLSETDNTK
ncbi:zinc ribbon domain-containing protein [Fructobacillus ficulneus]|uniref:TcaA 4th domain-containing protein n=1 Tax=Fructobacillus ficulneus TaxID=157463 RepID=A0A0K8MHB2_9LACO|nr:hypothetical protein [Fructobacillus ficulneus]GAO99925.1 hypothetical protein FFIC_260390 [Fructobacillus ficulneus]